MKYRLQDLIDVKQFQALQERLNEIYRFPSAIIDNDGNILTATAWQDVCTKFHRAHHECEKECIKSDRYILSHLHEANPAVSYRCPHGLVDNATPIIIEGVHYGNFFTGQFFLEKPDLEFFRDQARRYGFEEEAYLAAVKRVPIWSKEQLNSYLFFIKGLIEVISQIGLNSLKEAEANRQIQESGRFNQQVIDSAHEGIIVYGADLRYQLWNPFMEKLTGLKASEVLGRHPLEVFPFLQDAGVVDRLKLALAGTVPEPVEFPYQTAVRSGWTIDTSAPLRNASGEVIGVIAAVQDITARKQAEEALRKSEAMVSEVIRSVPQGIFWKDRHGVYLGCNEVFARSAGRSDPKAIVGKTDFDLPWPRAEAEAYRADDQLVMESGEPRRHIIEPLQKADGSRLWIDTTKVPLRAADGRVTGVLGVFEDVTERKAREEALLLRGAALEAAANAIVITDLQGTVEWANPAFTTLSGWELSEALGKNPRDLVKSDRHDAAFYRQMWETIHAGRVWQGEVINRRKDGELRTENMTITPVRGGQGTISHFIAIKQDVTRQKAVEEHLLQAQRIEAIGTLASGVAHDLNNILAPILLVAGLLKDAQGDAGNREMLTMVQSSAQRGSEIVKQLLTFSRGQKGERIPVQVRHLIKEIMMVARETFPRNIDLHQDLANDLWTITADPTQMHQVLLNLCVNARDAMPKGGHLTIGAANVMLDEKAPALALGAHPGPYLAIKVCDTGHGIPPEIRHRIFDPFFTTKPLGAGTGLGLSTVLGVVQNHGGFVTVDSAPDQGTTFTVFLPAQAKGALEFPLETAAPTAPAESASNASAILLVDDEPAIIRATKLLLERHGFIVITAVNGQDALIQYLQNRAQVRLVLSDLMMPVMNGVDLVRALRALDPALRIIVTSGLSDVVPTEALAELGLREVLKKPCDPGLLIATVQQQLAAG